MELLLPMGLLLLASGTFSGAEAALFTLSAQGLKRVPKWARPMLEQSVSALTVILFGNLLLNLSYFALATAWASRLTPTEGALIEVFAILVIVLFGEILPSAVMTGPYQLAIGAALAPFVRALMLITAPISWPIAKLLDVVLGHHGGMTRFKRNEFKWPTFIGALALSLALLLFVQYGLIQGFVKLAARFELAFVTASACPSTRGSWRTCCSSPASSSGPCGTAGRRGGGNSTWPPCRSR